MSGPTRAGELSWFRRPSPDRQDPGTLNACFAALDAAVVAGRSDEVFLLPPTPGTVPLTFARVLEDVAAIAGALRSLGAAPGSVVLVDLDDPLVRLACARLGAVVVAPGEGALDPADPAGLAALVDAVAPVVVLTDRHAGLVAALTRSSHQPEAAVVRGSGPVGAFDPVRDFAWDEVVPLGRDDPAGCAEVPADAPYSLSWGTDPLERSLVVRTVQEQAEALAALAARAPVSLAELGRVLG